MRKIFGFVIGLVVGVVGAFVLLLAWEFFKYKSFIVGFGVGFVFCLVIILLDKKLKASHKTALRKKDKEVEK